MNHPKGVFKIGQNNSIISMETIELILEIFKPIFKFVLLSLGWFFTIKWSSESKWLRQRKLDLFVFIATSVIYFWVAFPPFS